MSGEALNALRALARIPIERCPAGSTDDWIIFNFNDYVITVGHVRDARAALTHTDGKPIEKTEGGA